jgi:hypothetical protein
MAGDDSTGGGAENDEVDETIVGIVQRVEDLLARIPERYHACTSVKVSPMRRVMKELKDTRRRHPTSPDVTGTSGLPVDDTGAPGPQ